MSNIIEHVVVFKVKDDASPSEVDAMVDRINSLASLEHPLHLSMAPLLRVRSSSFNFTHILHARYASKIDLDAYTVHPSHVAVVKANAPLCHDTMALDWVAEGLNGGDLVIPPPGSAVRVTFFKLKEGLGDAVRDEAVRAIREIQEELKGAVGKTCGENFSPGRAKGFSIASIVVFAGLRELEAAGSDGTSYDKIKEHLDSVVALDFVVPSPKPPTSASL